MVVELQWLSRVPLFETSGTVTHQAISLSMGFPRQEDRSELLFSSPRGSSQPRDRTSISCNAGGFFYFYFFLSYISISHNIIGLAGLKVWVIITNTSISSPTFFYIFIAYKYGKIKNDAVSTFCSVTLCLCVHVCAQ